jgi:hypothetical protein
MRMFVQIKGEKIKIFFWGGGRLITGTFSLFAWGVGN